MVITRFVNTRRCSSLLYPLANHVAVLILIGLSGSPTMMANAANIFESNQDIGVLSLKGAVTFEESTGAYEITGGGANMWFTNDAFHFTWKRMSGDFRVAAGVTWPQPGGNAHRKACLLVRQSLAGDAAYVDVAVHGDGLTSLQFREVKGGQTREVQANQKSPAAVGLERQGDTFVLLLGPDPQSLQAAGPTIRIRLTDPVYVGLGVCSHDDSALETARFSGVTLVAKQKTADAKPILHSTLETIAIASKDRRAVYHKAGHFEAPNWSRDGSFFLFNSSGRIYRLPVAGGEPAQVDTGFANHCNNDHGISADGKLLVISDQSENGKSLIYTLPIAGGTPRKITPVGPSYWHGWSPDGTTLVYCAERNNEFDVYSIPAAGGEEKRLTTAKGLDDGPEYTADGAFVYFNSDRTGTMQVWRMKPDGSQQEQLTKDDSNNWFPHPSPDGKWVVFLSYDKEVSGHPANKLVKLRLMPLGGGPIQELAQLFGGQGTINVSSWSPDSRQIAFVSYELLLP